MAQTNRRTLTPTTKELTQQQLNEQSVMAIEWVQQSGEYAALAHQAFNLAKIAFEHAVAKKVKNPAVIVDIDETVLDNSAYQAGLIDTNHLFSPSSWHQWVLTEKARAIPGAVAFVNYVHAQGGKVFFISNRAEKSSQDSQDNELELATINNLQAVGLTGVNDSSVLLKGEFSRVIDGVENTSKQFRREAVENGNADGKFYTIVALVGDNLNDFDGRAGITNRQRRAHVATMRNRYGIFDAIPDNDLIEPAYIALPNPMYGAWESGLYNPASFGKERWFELSPSEKNQQRKKALRRWIFY